MAPPYLLGTRCIELVLVSEVGSGRGDGYTDNLSLVLCKGQLQSSISMNKPLSLSFIKVTH